MWKRKNQSIQSLEEVMARDTFLDPQVNFDIMQWSVIVVIANFEYKIFLCLVGTGYTATAIMTWLYNLGRLFSNLELITMCGFVS